MTTQHAIEIHNLSKHYPSLNLEDISFNVPSGFITGFIGPNGAGKTTTIKTILGITSPDAGSITVLGNPVVPGSSEDQIGIVMDEPLYVGDWTVADVETSLKNFYQHWDASKYAHFLNVFKLDANKKVKDLSRGMKVKVQLAVALSHDAKLLILDEPTSGLDPVSRDQVDDILREFVSDDDKTVFFSTHITSDLEKTADYITFLLDGKVAFTGTKDDLLYKYLRVAGGNDLTGDQRAKVIGYRASDLGFEGLILAADAPTFGNGFVVEPANLDEIIVFMNREVA
jgi:ABC-2 type transport system ATP-binding protein